MICITVSIPENEENKNKDLIVRTFSLDDVWSPMDLNTVGVKFGDDNCSKFLISTGNRDVIEEI